MKDLLIDVVRQAAPLFDKVRVIGGDVGVRVEAYTDDRNLFLNADLRDTVPELAGEFGLSNLNLLKGLLDFASYKTDGAQLQARRQSRDDLDFVAELEFRDDAGGYTRFKTIHPRMIGDRAKIANINWGISVSPSKAKLAEVIQLTTMLSQVDQHFSVSHEDRKLLLTIGGKGASNHNATVALASDIDCGPLPTKMAFRAPHFLAVLKNAGAQCVIRFAKEGVAGIVVETDHGVYDYILRGNEG